MKRIFISGGQRSGKSAFAERMALSMSRTPVYMATAAVCDDEMRVRVQAHISRRGECWTNIEEKLYLSEHDVTGRVVLVDCLTFWAMNFFFECGEQHLEAFGKWKEEFDRLLAREASFIFVTNEIGLGGISGNAMQRHFTDLQGLVNQYAAAACDEAYITVSGIPLRLA